MSATPALMTWNRQSRIDHPQKFPSGMRVRVFPDHIWLGGLADRDQFARALQFVQWLAREGQWTAEVDQRRAEPLGDPRRLFPDGLADPEDLDNNRTLAPVREGTLVTWSVSERTFAVHSSGQWRYEAGRRWLRGHLTAVALAAWNASVAAIVPDDLSTEAEPDEAKATRVEIEDPDGFESVEFDTSAPPTGLRPLGVMLERWMAWLDRWTPQTQIAESLGELTKVRFAD